MKPLFLFVVVAAGLGAQTLQETVDRAAGSAKGIKPDQLGMTVIDLSDRSHPVSASYRGTESFYPASVVKLFYLVAAHAAMEAGTLQTTPELERAIHDMITSSSNDATQLVFSSLTGTTGGPELPEAELKPWLAKREAVNQYFRAHGYSGISVNQPTFAEDPYGRERQARGPNFENNNRVTTDAVAQLWKGIVERQAVTPLRSEKMLSLLRRDPFASESKDEQATDFGGKALPAGSQYWSKAGWTSTARHDSAWVRLPNGAEYIFVAFTRGVAKDGSILPYLHGQIAAYFLKHPPTPDLLLTNGRIWTGNPAEPWTDRVAVRGDRITGVGTGAHAAAHTVDLKGHMVVPGFIDDHTHFIDGGFALLSVPLRDAATQAEFRKRIGDYAGKLRSGRWITGGDWDHELWPGGPLPTKELIDEVTRHNPVAVNRLDGHMILANSLALKAAGITRGTPDPPGGTIVRDAAGEPTGILKDAAKDLVDRVIPEPSAAEYEEALQAAMAEAARNGVTSIDDITLWPHWEVYQRARDAGKLTLRISARTPMASWRKQADLAGRIGSGDDWLRLEGLKAFMDGSLGSTTALFFQPFSDAPNTSGLMADDNLPEGKLRDNIIAADAEGLQCSVHAIGDKANHILLDYFAEAERENGPRDRRFRIEHAQHLLASDIPRFAELGVIASVQPYHAIDDGRWAEKRIGPERIKTTYAFRSLLDAKAKVVFGSDWTVAPLKPLLGIYAAVTRATLDGKNPNGWVPQQKVTVEEALRAYTSTGAYAEFSEREKGTIEPGKLADMVVLSEDLLQVPPEQLAKVQVETTIVGGKVVYSAH